MPSHYDISPITGLPQKRARKAVSDYLDWLSRGGGWQDVGVGDIFSPENRARLGDIAARARGELEGPVQPLTRPLLGDPEEAGMQVLDLVTPLAGMTSGIRSRAYDLFEDLARAEGRGVPRQAPLEETPLRRRRLARQEAAQERLFPVREPGTPFQPDLPATPKTGTRTTVIRPQRKAYPGIYQAEPEILEQASRQWTPESPNLRDVFGVSRADVDLGFRDLEQQLLREPRRGVQFAPTTARAADYPRQVMGEANTRRLRNILGMAGEDPRFAGAYGWYWGEPLFQDYVRLLGPEEGERQFRRFHQQGAALSPGSAVPEEIQRSSLYNWLSRQGDPGGFTTGSRLPEGAGHIYHTGSHRIPLERSQRTGTVFETNPLQAAKTKAYYGARVGENVWSPIMDAHFVRGIGLSDVRPQLKSGDPGASIGEREAGRVADWYSRKVAQPLGQGGVGAQALQWNVLAPQTGVRSPVGAPFLEILADIAAARGAETGRTGRETLDEFILGREHLFSR